MSLKKNKSSNPYFLLRKSFYSRLAIIGSSGVNLYLCLMSHVNWKNTRAGNEMMVWPGTRTIETETGMRNETIYAATRRLMVLGYLQIEKEGEDHHIVYYLTYGILDETEFQYRVDAVTHGINYSEYLEGANRNLKEKCTS